MSKVMVSDDFMKGVDDMVDLIHLIWHSQVLYANAIGVVQGVIVGTSKYVNTSIPYYLGFIECILSYFSSTSKILQQCVFVA